MTSLFNTVEFTYWPVLLQCALKGTLVLLLAFVAAFLLRRAAAANRHAIWLLALIAVLAMPLFTLILPAWHAIPPIPAGVTPSLLPTDDLQTVMTDAPPASIEHVHFCVILVAVWLAGALLALVPVLLARLSLWRLAASAEPLETWVVSGGLGIRRRLRVLRSNQRSMPMTWGILRPRLILPLESVEWPMHKRNVVIAHELAHVRRWDCLTQLMARVAVAIHWYNPLAWIAAGRMSAECESACDDQVLNLGTSGPDYAEQLVRIASAVAMRPIYGAAAIGMARTSKLERRVRAILDSKLNRNGVAKSAILMALAAALVLVVPIAMLRAEEKADFKPRLQFRLVASSPADVNADSFENPGDPAHSPLFVSKDVLLDERSVASVSPDTDNLGHHVISLQLTEEGGKRFAEITTANVRRQLAVILDGKLLMWPTINTPITGGKAMITAGADGYSGEQQNQLIDELQSAIQSGGGQAVERDPGNLRIRHFVLVVVAPDRMTFQGKDVTWDQLPRELENVPDRHNTVLSVGYSSDQVTLAQFNEARFGELAEKLGFAYLSNVGQQPIGAKGRGDVKLESVGEAVRRAITTISQCTETDPRVSEAMYSLKDLPEEQAVVEVTKYLSTDAATAEMRRAAIYVIWQGSFHDVDPAIDSLLTLCNSVEDYTRGMSALALGAHHVKSAEPILINMVTDDNSGYARRCAAYSLGLLGDPAAMGALEQATHDKEAAVATNARAAIRMLKGQ